MNSRSMDYRDRRPYRKPEYDHRIRKAARFDAKRRELPNLHVGSNAMNLRIVYPHTIFVVGVTEEISDAKVCCLNKSVYLSQFRSLI